MPVTDILDILQPTEGQSLKMTSVSQSFEQIAEQLGEIYTIDASSAVDSSTDNFNLPYDNTDDLSDRSGIRFIYLRIIGTPAVTFYVRHPNVKHLFFVENQTTQQCRLYVEGESAGNANGRVNGENGNILYSNGSNMSLILANQQSTKWLTGFQYWGTPPQGTRLGTVLLTRNAVIRTDVAAQIVLGSNPSGNYDIVVDAGGNSEGRFIVSSGGGLTWDPDFNNDRTILAGEELQFIAGSLPQGISDIRLALELDVDLS